MLSFLFGLNTAVSHYPNEPVPLFDLSFVPSVHQAHFLHTREGGPPQRAPAHVLGAGGGAERAPGAGRVWRLQPEHGPVLVLGAVRGGAVRGHD